MVLRSTIWPGILSVVSPPSSTTDFLFTKQAQSLDISMKRSRGRNFSRHRPHIVHDATN
uniref:Putative glutathione S-transferase n=1 Tax=Rhizobium rhizogenes TaxID=359 RepID=A0A7S5DR60_RHIRH|nr:putative glutathione S-transferase [Rhizobium rhizogenes]